MPPIIGLTLNYRDPERTYRCVESLLAEGIELVLIWDNSEDDGTSAATLRHMLANESRVIIHESPANLGFAAGVNHGLAMIRERNSNAWVLLINNDAALQPNSLKDLTQALSSHPQAVLAYPTIDHNGCLIGATYYHRILALITAKPLPGSFPYASGCCQLIAPERYLGKLYDEDFFMYGEDAELGYRLGSARMIHVPSARVHHEGSASSQTGTLFYETRLVESHLHLIGKLASNRLGRGLLFLGRLLTLPTRALVRTMRYRSLVPLKALVAGWCLALPFTHKSSKTNHPCRQQHHSTSSLKA